MLIDCFRPGRLPHLKKRKTLRGKLLYSLDPNSIPDKSCPTPYMPYMLMDVDPPTATDALATAAVTGMTSMDAAATSSRGAPEPTTSTPPPHAVLHGTSEKQPVQMTPTHAHASPQEQAECVTSMFVDATEQDNDNQPNFMKDPMDHLPAQRPQRINPPKVPMHVFATWALLQLPDHEGTFSDLWDKIEANALFRKQLDSSCGPSKS